MRGDSHTHGMSGACVQHSGREEPKQARREMTVCSSTSLCCPMFSRHTNKEEREREKEGKKVTKAPLHKSF